MPRKDVVLVTGSGGFIGGWIVETLYYENLATVRAGVRSWSSAARLGRLPLEIVPCDVMDKDSVRRAMTGVDCIIHCAVGSTEVIMEGTKNMLEAALAQGVKRFVHVSTTEVYGDPNGEVDETTPLKRTGNPYGDAKIDAENLCWESYKMGLPVTIVRPPIVYGPFSRDWTVGFAQKLQSGNWGIFKGFGEGPCNLVYVADLVSGILLAIRSEHAVGQAFNLCGPSVITWNDYFQKFNSVLGLPTLREIDPSGAKLRATVMEPIRVFGKLVLRYFRAPLRKVSQQYRQARELLQYTDKTLKTNPRTAELALYNRNALYLSSKARDMLGYKPVFGIERGLDLSVKWLVTVGLAERVRGG